VETLSARFVNRLELKWTQPTEMTVATRPIVEGTDVVGHVGDRQLAVFVDLLLDPLFLEAAEERFGDRVAQRLRISSGSRLSWVVGEI
jgi:hypothetical protein